jgi:hypothetical protein
VIFLSLYLTRGSDVHEITKRERDTLSDKLGATYRRTQSKSTTFDFEDWLDIGPYEVREGKVMELDDKKRYIVELARKAKMASPRPLIAAVSRAWFLVRRSFKALKMKAQRRGSKDKDRSH